MVVGNHQELASYTTPEKTKKHGKHRKDYFISTKWREYNRLKQQEYRRKRQSLKPFKTLSQFQEKKTQQLLRILVNQKSFVPVPTKLKHPVIKNWNADNYWYNKKIDLNNLERGCVRILKDNWNNCTIVWLDIDSKKFTKIAKQLRCGYITSPKGHIRIPFPVKNLANLKTGTLYYQDKKIGDAKLSGEVMLPNMAYYDKKGQWLGYYRYKAWGTFFPLNNRIWANPQQFFTYLQVNCGIEYLSISQHLNHLKDTRQTTILEIPNYLEISSLPVPEPPWQKTCIHQGILSQNRH